MGTFPAGPISSTRTTEQRLRVYVSANSQELAAECGAVREVIARLRQTPVLFVARGRPHPPRYLFQAYLPQSDIFVGIYWEEYGQVAPGETISCLEEEYNLSGALSRLIYAKSPAPKREPGLKDLLARIKNDGLSYRYFSSTEELADLVENDLAQILQARSQPGRAGDKPAPEHPTGPLTNLTVATDRFIGREIQVEAIRRLLAQEENRLVSLTGPGGVGKTRLAIQAAMAGLGQFPGGVFYIDLSTVSDPALLLPAIARATGEHEAAGEQMAIKLNAFFRSRRALLVLDNLDSPVSAGLLIVDLLAAAPQLKALATSRSALRLNGELEFPVLPLSLPGLSHRTVEAAGESEAVQLFAYRAGSALALNAENAPAVAEICRRLDGLPLAIELAAARARHLHPADLLADLDEWAARNAQAIPDLPPRQRTQRAAIEWSYDRLEPDGKILFARLAVFHGGCTLDAIEAVCNPEGAQDMLASTSALVEHSFLRRELDIEGRLRFEMPDTLRDFAMERLLESGEMAVLQERHAHFYRSFAAEAIQNQSISGLGRLEFEIENLRAALEWSLNTPGALQPGVDLANDLFWFWHQHGHLTEANSWFERLLQANPDKSTREWGGILAGAGMVAGWLGNLASARRRLDESIPLLRGTSDRKRLALALLNRGALAAGAGRAVEALPDVDEALLLFRTLNDRFFSGVCLMQLGDIALAQNRPDEARHLLAEMTAIARGIGDLWLQPTAIHHQGDVARYQGDYSRAGAYYDESGVMLHEITAHNAYSGRSDLARILHNQAYVTLRRGDARLAGNLFRQSLETYLALGIQRGTAECLAGLAGVDAAQGRWMPAARLLGFAQALIELLGLDWQPADRREIEQARASLQKTLGEELFHIEESAGRKLKLETVLAIYL